MASSNIFVIASCLVLAIFIVATLYFWKRKGEIFRTVIIGAATFFVFSLLFENILNSIIVTLARSAAYTIANNIVLYVAYGCAMAGVFEEMGRYFAFKQVMPEYKNRSDAIGYGIGHGGLELVLSGILMLLVDAPQGFDAGMSMLWILERITAFCGQTALSVVVFTGVQNKSKHMLPFAILLHAIADIPIGLYKFGTISLRVCDVVFLGCVLACCLFAKASWSDMVNRKRLNQSKKW